jgi:hypothetical protein
LPITREQPDHVFKTSDGRYFTDAQEAHCHERYIQIQDAVREYVKSNNTQPGVSLLLFVALEELAPKIALIVRATPLANA